MYPRLSFVFVSLLLLAAAPASGAVRGEQAAKTSRLVHDQAEYAAAVRDLQAGGTIVLADGVWRDFPILFTGTGKAAQPLRLTAQTAGKVILSGQSSLRLAGEYLEVSNLVFRDGWSPTGEVVSFRKSSTERAAHSRVTGVVIDRFNKPDRGEADHWVALYGHDNRFDHGHIAGKTNRGTTLVVVRDEQQGLDNRHRIDHNWFGPRPNLGSNGGETIRVGTSHDSMSDSHTVVEDNWFEGCDGEVEIVSNKSGGNVYRGNVFFHSRGALVLRHGDGNLVERNVFLGGNKPHTGGIRIINRRQTVRDNYLEGLAGDGFASALSIMYGVPDSPINRYVQVDGAVIERNTLVDVASILLGAGMDAERSAAPVRSRIAGNLIVNVAHDPLRVQGDLSGIAFDGNVQSPTTGPDRPDGIAGRSVAMTRMATGLLVPDGVDDVGAARALQPIARTEVGVDWYAKDAHDVAFDSGARRDVAPGDDTLTEAVIAAAPGDTLVLAAGRYATSQVLAIDHPLTLQGPTHGEATLLFSRPLLFDLKPGGALKLAHIVIDGAAAPDEVGNAVIRIAPGSGTANYTVIVEDSTVRGLTVNRGFDVINTGKDTMADLIALRRVRVDDVSGSVVSAAAETDDRGTYNAERVEIVDSQFHRVGGPVVDLYRGGTDESTFGPSLSVRGSTFANVGADGDASLRLRGVQYAELADNRFTNSAGVHFSHRVGTPVLLATGNQFEATPAIQSDIHAGSTR